MGEGTRDLRDDRLPYVCVYDVAATWEQYERLARPILEPAPEGLALHLAGPTDEGFRMIAVWRSESDCQRFHARILAPAIAASGVSRRQPTVRTLHSSHVVFGDTGSADWLIPEDERRLSGSPSRRTTAPCHH